MELIVAAKEVGLLLVPLVAVAVAAAALLLLLKRLVLRHLTHSWTPALRAFAEAHALKSDGSRLWGRYQGLPIELAVSTKRHGRGFTIVSATVEALPSGMWLRHRGRQHASLANLSRAFGGRRLETRDAELDQVFLMGGDEAVRGFVTRPGARAALLELAAEHDVAIDGAALRIWWWGAPSDVEGVRETLDHAVAVARVLEREATQSN